MILFCSAHAHDPIGWGHSLCEHPRWHEADQDYGGGKDDFAHSYSRLGGGRIGIA